MQKILSFSLNDIIYDPEAIAEAVNRACSVRTGPYAVRGLCQMSDAVYFVLHPVNEETGVETYHFVLMQDTTSLGVSSELEARWCAGHDCVGNILLEDGTALMLYATCQESD